jgi:hypothetical protein
LKIWKDESNHASSPGRPNAVEVFSSEFSDVGCGVSSEESLVKLFNIKLLVFDTTTRVFDYDTPISTITATVACGVLAAYIGSLAENLGYIYRNDYHVVKMKC